MPDPLMMTGAQGAKFLGFGPDKFRRLVRKGVIPSWTDPDTGRRHYSRPVLEQWAATAETPTEADPTPPHGIPRRKAS